MPWKHPNQQEFLTDYANEVLTSLVHKQQKALHRALDDFASWRLSGTSIPTPTCVLKHRALQDTMSLLRSIEKEKQAMVAGNAATPHVREEVATLLKEMKDGLKKTQEDIRHKKEQLAESYRALLTYCLERSGCNAIKAQHQQMQTTQSKIQVIQQPQTSDPAFQAVLQEALDHQNRTIDDLCHKVKQKNERAPQQLDEYIRARTNQQGQLPWYRKLWQALFWIFGVMDRQKKLALARTTKSIWMSLPCIENEPSLAQLETTVDQQLYTPIRRAVIDNENMDPLGINDLPFKQQYIHPHGRLGLILHSIEEPIQELQHALKTRYIPG